MVNSCIVANCPTNKIKKGNPRPSTFKVTRDSKLLEQWIKNLPPTKKILTHQHYVCELHFDKNDISKAYEENLPQGKWTMYRYRPCLKPNTVPIYVDKPTSITNNKENHTLKSNSNYNIEQVNEINVENETNKDSKEHLELLKNTDNIQDNNEESTSDDKIDVEEFLDDQDNNQDETFTLKTIHKKFSTLKLPNKAWNYFSSPNLDLISFYTIQNDSVLRRVDIQSDLSVQVLIDIILISDNHMPQLTCLNDVVSFLTTVSCWNLCESLKNAKGCIPLGLCKGIIPWSLHENNAQKICNSCMIKTKRPISPDNENTLEKQRKESKKRRVLVQKLRRQKIRIQSLEAQVSVLRKHCAKISNESFEKYIKVFNQTVKDSFRDCFMAAKKIGENEDEMKYDIEWVDQCILTRENYTDIYDILREENSLPLPSKLMLRQYTNLFV